MPNTNVLAGLKCPNCGSFGPYRMVVRCWTEVSDDGTHDSWDHEWGEKDPCNCISCNFMGTVRDFEPRMKPPLTRKKK